MRIFTWTPPCVAVTISLLTVPALAGAATLSQPLALGSHGGEVAQLQIALRDKGVYTGDVTGYFGAKTESAVQQYQLIHGLEPLGSVGPQTRALLNASQDTTSYLAVPTLQDHPGAASGSAKMPTDREAVGTSVSLPYRSDTFTQWKQAWGVVGTSPGGVLHLSATTTGTGAGAIFPGSLGWGDYFFTANITVAQGSATLYGRYVDDNNYAACVFSGNYIAVIERVGGVRTKLASATVSAVVPRLYFNTTISISLWAKGHEIGCSALGPEPNVSATIDDSLARGGIGVETWHEVPGVARLDLNSVRAEPI